MNRTSQGSEKQGDGRSGAATGTAHSPQTSGSTSTGSQSSSTGFQAGSTGTQSSSGTGTQGAAAGSNMESRSTGSQTGGQTGQGQQMDQRYGGRSEAESHREGTVAKSIEKQTAKLPSDLFLWAAAASIGVSAAFEFTGHKDKSRFIGQWVAPFLLLGVYNKLVKTQGSDRYERNFDSSSGRMGYAGQRTF